MAGSWADEVESTFPAPNYHGSTFPAQNSSRSRPTGGHGNVKCGVDNNKCLDAAAGETPGCKINIAEKHLVDIATGHQGSQNVKLVTQIYNNANSVTSQQVDNRIQFCDDNKDLSALPPPPVVMKERLSQLLLSQVPVADVCRPIELVPVETGQDVLSISLLSDTGGQCSTIPASHENIAEQIFVIPGRKVALQTENFRSDEDCKIAKLSIATANEKAKKMEFLITSSKQTKQQAPKKYCPPKRLVKKYKLMDQYHIPAQAVILVGMDKPGLLAKFVERAENCNIYWSQIQSVFFPSYSPSSTAIKPNNELEKYFQMLGYINLEPHAAPPQCLAESLNLINKNNQKTATDRSMTSPLNMAATTLAVPAAVSPRPSHGHDIRVNC